MPPLSGQVCVVTGASSGIGYHTARALAGLGAQVLIVGRDATRTEAAARAIAAYTANPHVESYCADLAELGQVRDLAFRIHERHARLDVLVNNAGAVFSARQETTEGFERTWALNHLAYFLLTQELLPLLRAAQSARIVNVASAMHTMQALDFDDLQGRRDWSGTRAYACSKLANVMFTYALARRLVNSSVTVNCLHPGVIASGFGRGGRGPLRAFMRLARPWLATPERGSRTSVFLASSTQVAGVSGGYFIRCRQRRSSRASLDVEAQERLWQISLQHCDGAGATSA